MNNIQNVMDFLKIIIPLSVLIGVISRGLIKVFYQTEIDRMLSTKQSRKNDEIVAGLIIALLFSVITAFGLITNLPFFQHTVIKLPFGKEFNLAFFYAILFMIGCFLFYFLLIAGAFPAIRKMSVFKKQIMTLLAKLTYFLIFLPALLIAFSIKLNVDELSIEYILLALTLLTVFYALILIYLTYLANILSHHRLKYNIRTVHQSEVDNHLEKLYFVYTLDKERFILSDKQHANAYNMFTPIYIYNHASNTLNIIDEVKGKVGDENSRLKTKSRKDFFG